ncbi:MAG: hypothetical protein AB8B97_24790 [Granulosicoccus sp.]
MPKTAFAKDNPSTEDITESFLMWMALRFMTDALSEDNRQRIEQAITARLVYLDQQDFSLNKGMP